MVTLDSYRFEETNMIHIRFGNYSAKSSYAKELYTLKMICMRPYSAIFTTIETMVFRYMI